MTATTTPDAVPLHKRFAWKAFLGPSVAGLIAVVLLGNQLIDRAGTGDADLEQTYNVSRKAAKDALTEALPPTPEPTTPPPPPGYDYLTCSHATPNDPVPCKPVLPWPLTSGAVNMIGFQSGARAQGQLNTANTRMIFDQLRRMMGVDTCSMWLSIRFDASMNPELTLHRSEIEAPEGASKLVDCAPRAGVTPGSVPTEGVA